MNYLSSGGNLKYMLSEFLPNSEAFVLKYFSSSFTSSLTVLSGAEAPAVTPIDLLFPKSDQLISATLSINTASTPHFSANSLSRFELELFIEPTTITISTSKDSCLTASCLF